MRYPTAMGSNPTGMGKRADRGKFAGRQARDRCRHGRIIAGGTSVWSACRSPPGRASPGPRSGPRPPWPGPPPRPAIGDPEDQVGLDEERDGDPEDGQGPGEDHFTLEGEEQDQGDQESGDSNRGEEVEEPLPEPDLAFGLDDPVPGQPAGGQGQGDIDGDRENQGLPGDGKPP